MGKSDFARLKHMVEAAQTSLQFIKGKKRKELENNKMLCFAVIRALEIVGEAASQVTKSFQSKHPNIQWRAIVGMRNRLIHAYFNIDYEIVWQAVKFEVPKLIKDIQAIINEIEIENSDLE